MAQVFITGVPNPPPLVDDVDDIVFGDLTASFTTLGGVDTPVPVTWSVSNGGETTYGTVILTPADTSGTNQTDTVTWTYQLDPDKLEGLDPDVTYSDSFTISAVETNEVFLFDPDPVEITIDVTGVCFAAGTQVLTDHGLRPVEALRAGDRVWTQDTGFQPVLWAGGLWYDAAALQADPALWPVRVAAGALGPERPARDLVVSQQHRIYVTGPLLELHLGLEEALVAAKHLCGLPGVEILAPTEPIGYFHLLCAGHQLIEVEGTLAETMFLGDEALHALTPGQLAELATEFASWSVGEAQVAFLEPTCRPVLKGHEARALFGRGERRAQGRTAVTQIQRIVSGAELPD